MTSISYASALLIAAALLVAACSDRHLAVTPLFSLNGESSAALSDPYEQGKAHLKEGRTVRAIQSLHLALVERPHSVGVINALAIAYEEIGRDDLALDYFERALELDPASPQTLNNLGYTALRHGETSVAKSYFQRALQQDARNAVVTANLNLLDQPRPNPEQQLAVVVREPVAIRRAAWVERTSEYVQTIVTRPDPALIAAAERAGVAPHLISFTTR